MSGRSNVEQRRFELVQRVSVGEDIDTICKEMGEKYHIKPLTIRMEWIRKNKWINDVVFFEPHRFTVDMLATLEWLKLTALTCLKTAKSHNERLNAIKTVEVIIGRIFDVAKTTGLIDSVPDKIKIVGDEITDLDMDKLSEDELTVLEQADQIIRRVKQLDR